MQKDNANKAKKKVSAVKEQGKKAPVSFPEVP